MHSKEEGCSWGFRRSIQYIFYRCWNWKYDLDKYTWRPEPSVSGGETRTRYLFGAEDTEDVFNRFMKGDQTLFFATYIDLSSSIPEDKLLQASRDTWLWLRYSVPTIAASVGVDEQASAASTYTAATLTYTTATSASANEWADRTFVVSRQTSIDLDELRRQLGPNKVPSSSGDQTWLHIVPGATDSKGTVSNVGFLFHTHHSPFDGAALKIILSRYLAKLAKVLSIPEGRTKEMLEWGKEIDNLSPSVSQVLAPTEPRPIPLDSTETPSLNMPYYSCLQSFSNLIGEFFQNPYGFKPRPSDPNWPSPYRLETLFTKEESERILAKLKPSNLDRKFTVTHLAHAALSMTVIADNPPSPEAASQALYNFSLADCRHRLSHPYNTRDGYAGYALGVHTMKIPVSIFLSDDDGKQLPLDKATLSKAMKLTRSLYHAEKAAPARLSHMAQATDFIGATIKQAVAANQLPPNNNYFFSSDGKGENYLDTTYRDNAGQTMLTVTKFFTSLNRVDPGPFFRTASWNGLIDISADFNSNITAVGDVKRYLETWKKFILLVLEFDDQDY